MRYLGIDYGEAHVGIAIGDDETLMALPLETVTNEGVQEMIEYLTAVIVREGIGAIVVGVPAMGVHYGEQRAAIEAVVKKMLTHFLVPVYTSDESFSSRQAQTLMRDRGPAPATDEHAIAAMLILQGYFEKRG
ncbi:MAG: Holliday junction resolvase RuvX [Patescibacteria group bacterium]